MKRKICQQRNSEIHSKTYVWAEVFFFVTCDQAFFVFFLQFAVGSILSQFKVITCLEIHHTHSRKACLAICPTCDLPLASVWPLKVALNLFTLTFHLNTGQIQRLCCLALILASCRPCLSHAKSDHCALRMKDYYGISQKFLERRMLWAANFKKIIRV